MDHKETSSRGGKARAKKLTKARRVAIARHAASKRWPEKKCALCKHPKGDHNAVHRTCPVGRRDRTGGFQFHATIKFTPTK